jgi:hypothetical protein
LQSLSLVKTNHPFFGFARLDAKRQQFIALSVGMPI